MDNCKQCTKPITSSYDVVCKTYYRLEDLSVLCYRHWHQANRPWFGDTGEHGEVFCEASVNRTIKAIEEKNKKESEQIVNQILNPKTKKNVKSSKLDSVQTQNGKERGKKVSRKSYTSI